MTKLARHVLLALLLAVPAIAPASERAQVPAGYPIAAGDTIQGVAATPTAITVTIFGSETSSSVEAYKALNTPAQLPASAGLLYTAPANNSALINRIILANTTGSAVSGVQLFRGGTAAVNRISGSITIPANGQAVYDGNGLQVTDANGALQTSSSGGSTYTASGGLKAVGNDFRIDNPLAVIYGGNERATLTNHAVMLGQGTNPVGFAGPGSPGQLLFSQGASADPSFNTLSQDCTVTLAGVITCLKTNNVSFAASATTDTTNASNISSGTLPDARLSNTITAGGPVGDASHVAAVTYDAHGRLTTVSSVAITPAAIGGVASVSNADGTIVVTGTATAPVVSRAAISGDFSIPSASNTGTLATVNSNTGSFGTASNVGTFTVNGKGLVTAASNTPIQIAESQVNGLVADLALKAPLASPPLTGVPTAPTAAPDTSTTQIATTAYAKGEADDAQAFAIQRANHTGTQLAATISNFATAVDTQTATNRQPLDTTLTNLAANNWALNSLPIGSGSDTVAQITFGLNEFPARASTGNLVAKTITDFGLSQVDDADATAGRATLGLGSAATQNTGTSGANIPFLNGTNTWGAVNTFSSPPVMSGASIAAATIPAASLVSTIAAGGPTGSSTVVPVITYNASGQLTAVSTAPITAAGIGAVASTRTLTAGAGMTGGGDLSADRTFDVVAADSTITVNANDIARAPLTGDVGCPGGSNTCTLATVNANVGTFGDSGTVAQIVANAKGLITAVTNVAIRTASALQSGFMSVLNYLELAGHYDAVADFGFVGDQVVVFDGACSTGAPTKITSATAQFDQTVGGVASYYNGKRITLAGAGTSGAMLAGTISAIDSATQVTISGATCITTVSSKGLQFGTDNTTAVALLESTINALTYQGAVVEFGLQPTNRFASSRCVTFNKQVALEGQGGSVNLDVGDYAKGGGTALAWWGTTHDCGAAFQGFIRFQPVVSATTVAFDSAASTSTSSAGATTLSLNTAPVGTPTLAIVDVQLTNGSSVTTLTYGGQTMTLVGCSAPGFSTCSYKLEYPPSGVQTVSLTYSAAGISAMGSTLYTGTGTGATSNFVSANGSGTPATLNVTSAANHIAHASLIVAGTSATATANNTSNYNVSFGSLPTRVGASQRAAGAATVTHSWTLGGTGLTWAENGFDISPNASAQPLVAPAMRHLWVDCRNGDQNNCYTGIQMFDVVGMDFNDVYVMDPMFCMTGDVLEPIGGTAALGRGQIHNFGCRVVELMNQGGSAGVSPQTPATIAAGSTGQVMTAAGSQTILLTALAYETPGYLAVTMTNGATVPVYCGTGGGAATTSVGSCRVSTNDAANNPTLVTGANIITLSPNTGGCTRWNGSATGNSNLFDANMWRCSGAIDGSGTKGFGMPCHDLSNADSISFNQIVNNCGAYDAAVPGVPKADALPNRVRKCGVKFNGSNVTIGQAARNNTFKDGDAGPGGACSMSLLNTGAKMLAPAGPNYWTGYQLGNNNAAPVIELGSSFEWPMPNGGCTAGLRNYDQTAATAYVVGTAKITPGTIIQMGPQCIQTGLTFHWRYQLAKTTAAGAAARLTNVRFGTTGTTADANVCQISVTPTAAIDNGIVDVFYRVTAAPGAASTGICSMTIGGRQLTATATGLIATLGTPVTVGTPTAFTSPVSTLWYASLTQTAGTAEVMTTSQGMAWVEATGGVGTGP